MRNYFKETDQVVRRELRRIVRQPMYWVLMVVLPVVSFAFFAVIFERGVARNIPIAVLDEDHTTLSRKVTQMIDDTPTAMVSYEVQSMEEAQRLARRLDEHNHARQLEEEKIRAEATAMLESRFSPEHDHVIVLGSRTWHPGVVGIVASLLMRRYHKPTFVISLDENGLGKGSGRSIPGVSLVQAIHHCADTLVSGGGHDMAAGLVIREEMIDAFRAKFDAYVRDNCPSDQLRPVLNIDAEVAFNELNLSMLDSYELLEPFGNSNPQPVFMSRNVMLTDAPHRVSGNHLRLCMRQGTCECDAMYFNAGNLQLPDPPWDIAFTIDRNVWRGRESLSLSIQDIRPAQP